MQTLKYPHIFESDSPKEKLSCYLKTNVWLPKGKHVGEG